MAFTGMKLHQAHLVRVRMCVEMHGVRVWTEGARTGCSESLGESRGGRWAGVASGAQIHVLPGDCTLRGWGCRLKVCRDTDNTLFSPDAQVKHQVEEEAFSQLLHEQWQHLK